MKVTEIKVNFTIVLSLVSINCLGTIFGISAFNFFSSVTFHGSFIRGHIICTYLFLIGLSNSLEAFISYVGNDVCISMYQSIAQGHFVFIMWVIPLGNNLFYFDG